MISSLNLETLGGTEGDKPFFTEPIRWLVAEIWCQSAAAFSPSFDRTFKHFCTRQQELKTTDHSQAFSAVNRIQDIRNASPEQA